MTGGSGVVAAGDVRVVANDHSVAAAQIGFAAGSIGAMSEPGFPADVSPGPLYAEYGRGVVALGFYVKAEGLPALRDALAA